MDKNQNNQFMLAKIAQEKNTMAADLLTKAGNNSMFPSVRLSALWRRAANCAIHKTQPVMQRVTLKEFAEAIKCDALCGNITMFQFGVLSNSIESVSIDELSLDKEEYLALVKESLEHIKYYNEWFEKTRKEITLKVDQDYQLKMAAEGKAPMSAVKAEA